MLAVLANTTWRRQPPRFRSTADLFKRGADLLEHPAPPPALGEVSGTVVRIDAGGVELRGLTVRGSGSSYTSEDAGVRIDHAADVRLVDLRIEDALFGVFASQADRCVVADTTIVGKDLPHVRRGDGIRLWYSSGCRLVGIELVEDAIELPAFAHPIQAAYVLGPERGVLSPELIARCAHLVRIPTAFSLNVATAGAIVMYDRLRSLGRFGSRRPVATGGAPGR